MSTSVYFNTQLKLTARLIKDWGVDIVLQRPRDYITTTAGGRLRDVGSPTELPSQKLYFGGKQSIPPNEAITDEGEQVSELFTLIGMPVEKYGLEVADIQENDTFDINGDKHLVLFVDRSLPYQVKAEVRRVKT